jgi:hypothetical protein
MKLANVNTTDIKDAVAMGCRTMSSVFNADDNDIPFFGSSVLPTSWLGFHPYHSESHVPGRHLNAMLTAEAVLGIRLEEPAVEKQARTAFFSYSGAVPLPLNRPTEDGKLTNFAPHNIREGFHALYALVRYRKSAKAREVAEASIAAINDLWTPERDWDKQKLEGKYGLKIIDFDSPFIGGIARAIGPLVKYHQATGYTPALRLATVLKDKALDGFFPASGACEIERLGSHTHSITCTLSSLAQLADATNDAALKARVKAFYDRGLLDISNSIGWSPENAKQITTLDLGEANNTGDILETALLLGSWGYTDCYHHAERILRGHLLPSQLRDTSFIPEADNPQNKDSRRNIPARHKGAFGFPAPYGHVPANRKEISFNMDIVGGAVSSLCEAWRCLSQSDSKGHTLNLLFDHENDNLLVRSPYTSNALQITVKRPGPLKVRIPSWVNISKLELRGTTTKPRIVEGYLTIPKPTVGKPITIVFPLTEQKTELRYRDRRIRALHRGDAIIAMENFGTGQNYFDPLP